MGQTNNLHCENCGNTKFHNSPFYYKWNNKEFLLKKCNQCALITLDPKPDELELGMLYSDEYFEDNMALIRSTKLMKKVRISLPWNIEYRLLKITF